MLIKGLHSTLNIEYIKPDLQEKGHILSKIVDFTKSGTSILLPMFLIEIEQVINNKDIYNISTLCNTPIKTELPKSNRQHSTIYQMSKMWIY